MIAPDAKCCLCKTNTYAYQHKKHPLCSDCFFAAAEKGLDKATRTKRTREQPEIRNMMLRMLRAMTARSIAGDEYGLAELAIIAKAARDAETAAARGLMEKGRSLADLAGALGISRQAVRERYK